MAGLAGRHRVEAAALGLADQQQHQQRQGDPWRAHGQERHPPAVEGGDLRPRRRTQRRAEWHAEGIERQGQATALGREIVRDQRIGGRRAAGLSDADADPRQGQGGEVAGHAARHGEQAPNGAGRGDDPHSMRAVCKPGQWDAEGGVEQGEGQAGQHADLCVAQPQVLADRLGQDRQQLPVEKVEGVDRRQQDHDDVAVEAGAHQGRRRLLVSHQFPLARCAVPRRCRPPCPAD